MYKHLVRKENNRVAGTHTMDQDIESWEIDLNKFDIKYSEIMFGREEEFIETEEKLVKTLRMERIRLFQLVDKYQLALIYNELTPEHKTELQDYRNALLNVTMTKVIPIKPEWIN